ncbi:hypothetical protein ACVMBZ_000779 [Bradyrhizobium liaoningense]
MTSSSASVRMIFGGAAAIGARRSASSALADVSISPIRHWNTSSNTRMWSSE